MRRRRRRVEWTPAVLAQWRALATRQAKRVAKAVVAFENGDDSAAVFVEPLSARLVVPPFDIALEGELKDGVEVYRVLRLF